MVVLAASEGLIAAQPAVAAQWALQPAVAPVVSNGELASVSCASPDACEAVGYREDHADVKYPLAERWDGSAWKTEDVPLPGTPPQADANGFATLTGVSCSAPDSCVAVGDVTPSQAVFAETWDGTRWTAQNLPLPPGVNGGTLNGISCSSTRACTAVGTYIVSGEFRGTLAEQWDGRQWAAQDTEAGAYAKLEAVSCPEPSACVAVGYEATSAATRTLVQTWNGSSWNVMPSPNVAGTYDNELNGISCTSFAECTAVGSTSAQPGPPSTGVLVERLESGAWSIQQAAQPGGRDDAGDPPELLSVKCTSATDCTAVGYYEDSQGQRLSLAEGWSGSEWTIQSTPADASALLGVDCAKANCFAVGWGVPGTLTLAFDGTGWEQQPKPGTLQSDASLDGVSCPGEALCFAVGKSYDYGAMIEQWDGTIWSEQPVPGASVGGPQLRAVSCPSTTFCMAVGDSDGSDGPIAFAWDGLQWTARPTPPLVYQGSGLTGISCISASFCLAVGYMTEYSGDTVAFAETWNGSGWTAWNSAPATMPNDRFNAVSCTSPTACLAVGEVDNRYYSGGGGFFFVSPNGPLAQSWDGAGFTDQSPSAPASGDGRLMSVECVSTSQCITAGDEAAAEWTDGAWAWQTLPPPDGASSFKATGVACDSATNCTLSGYGADSTDQATGPAAATWDGSGWTEDVPVTADNTIHDQLDAIACPLTRYCVAVGAAVAPPSEGTQYGTFDMPLAESAAGPGVPTSTSPPMVTGTPRQGEALTVHNGTWTGTPTTYSHHWEDCDSAGTNCMTIAGATGATYQLTSADVGSRIEVVEAVSSADGQSTPAVSGPTDAVSARPTTDPTSDPASGPTSDGLSPSGVSGNADPGNAAPVSLAGATRPVETTKNGAGRPGMSSVRWQQQRVTAVVSCRGALGQTCAVTLRLLVVERVRRGKIVAINLTPHARRTASTQIRTVTIGSASYRLGASQRAKIRVGLTRIGEHLLARYRTLRAELLLTDSGRVDAHWIVMVSLVRPKGSRSLRPRSIG